MTNMPPGPPGPSPQGPQGTPGDPYQQQQPGYSMGPAPAPGQSPYGPPQQLPQNGLGTAGLVCGVIGLALAWIPFIAFFGWVLGILGIIFGSIGLAKANKGEATNKGMAIGGLATGILALVLPCVVGMIFWGGMAGTMSM
ncbi:DUF4190 domain-containing protein [Haloglycomyces albus]|uniref:DUF4190 domain-containing protein n=1 Tax=Haloglycomyces albus TaxID=526067 RepID=UPI00046D5245|nr:DUF4190 domain-containing protein [Haloglycomyces albus]